MGTGSTLAAIPLSSLKYQISVVPTPPLIPSVLMGFAVGTVATVAQAWGSSERQSSHLHWYKGSVADSALMFSLSLETPEYQALNS